MLEVVVLAETATEDAEQVLIADELLVLIIIKTLRYVELDEVEYIVQIVLIRLENEVIDYL